MGYSVCYTTVVYSARGTQSPTLVYSARGTQSPTLVYSARGTQSPTLVYSFNNLCFHDKYIYFTTQMKLKRHWPPNSFFPRFRKSGYFATFLR